MASDVVNAMAFPDSIKEYIINVIDPILEPMVEELMNDMPPVPVDGMIGHLRKRFNSSPSYSRTSVQTQNTAMKKELRGMMEFMSEVGDVPAEAKPKAKEAVEEDSEEESDDDAEDEAVDVMAMAAKSMNRGPRQSVSAEAYGAWNVVVQDFKPPVHEKSDERKQELSKKLSMSFLFSALEPKDLDIVILAMEEVTFEADQRVIEEGADGDYLFVINEGTLDCKKLIDGELKVVKTCGPGDVFGELALLYNCPRAATVDATVKCTCWKLDRETFSHIVKEAATQRSMAYDKFLSNVNLFAGLDSFERSRIVDALKCESYKKGDTIVKQGDPGDRFYLLEEGNLVVMKSVDGGESKEVLHYKSGDYFGELALLKNQPRAASIVVTSETAKVLFMQSKMFVSMIGPLKELLQRQFEKYNL